jgi:hypothetical protein
MLHLFLFSQYDDMVEHLFADVSAALGPAAGT